MQLYATRIKVESNFPVIFMSFVIRVSFSLSSALPFSPLSFLARTTNSVVQLLYVANERKASVSYTSPRSFCAIAGVSMHPIVRMSAEIEWSETTNNGGFDRSRDADCGK